MYSTLALTLDRLIIWLHLYWHLQLTNIINKQLSSLSRYVPTLPSHAFVLRWPLTFNSSLHKTKLIPPRVEVSPHKPSYEIPSLYLCPLCLGMKMPHCKGCLLPPVPCPRRPKMPQPTFKLTFSVESKIPESPEHGRARAYILPRVYQGSYVTPRCLGTTPIHGNTVA